MYDAVIEQVVEQLIEQVGQATTDGEAAPTVTAGDATVVYGRAGTTMTVTVDAPGSDDIVPTGEVELRSGDAVPLTEDLAGGSARVEIPPRWLAPRATPHPVTVLYDGDGEVAPGSGTAEITVQRTPVVLLTTVTPRRPTVRQTRVKVIVEVVNAYGVPRAGTVTATARDAGSRSDTLVGGRVTLRLPAFTTTGRKTVVVRYGGSRYLLPARQRMPVRVVR